MGAFDEVNATAECPACGARHRLVLQTKFFVPDFGGLHSRWFKPFSPQPLDFNPDELFHARCWDDQWVRVRDAVSPKSFTLLADWDDHFYCSCKKPVAWVLEFTLLPPDGVARDNVTIRGMAVLTGIRGVDARAPDLLERVDFADAEGVVAWGGEFATWASAVEALGELPEPERMQRFRQHLLERFPLGKEPPLSTDGPWTTLEGPTRCSSCGEARDRVSFTLLSHPDYSESVLGPGWHGGHLRLGDHFPFSQALNDVGHRGYYVRLRPPADRRELCTAESPARWSCRCGDSPAIEIAHFAVERDEVVLSSLELRSIHEPAQLRDIDYACASGLLLPRSPPLDPSLDLDARIAKVLAEWKLS
jgi:hypothetical protein